MVPRDSTQCHNDRASDEPQVWEKTNSKRRRTSVHFKRTCELYRFPAATDADVDNSWYEAADYKLFKGQAKQVLRERERTSEEEIESVLGESCHGLNVFGLPGSMLRKQRRISVWDTVLDGQDENQDPDIIARNYAALSAEAAVDARSAAQNLATLEASINEDSSCGDSGNTTGAKKYRRKDRRARTFPRQSLVDFL